MDCASRASSDDGAAARDDPRASTSSRAREAGEPALLPPTLVLPRALVLAAAATLGVDLDVGNLGRGGERRELGAPRDDAVAVSTEMCETVAGAVTGAGKGESGRDIEEPGSSMRERLGGRPRGLRGRSARGAIECWMT